jgi:hypothetical protein
MAIDSRIIKLLLWSKNLGAKFDRTATLGRQGLVCSPKILGELFAEFGLAHSEEQVKKCFVHEPCRDIYADEFIRSLGATDYVSVDRSGFEGANFLHDLNDPFPEKMRNRFDFVLDGGTLEHVFNYPAALKHSLELVKVGGHFLTIPPANGHMGHGFYQCSPELFFSVFTPQNGFAIKKIVLYESYRDDAQFYEVSSPAQLKGRVELSNSPPVSLAILAQRIAEVPIFAQPPQQSDYVAAWAAVAAAAAAPVPMTPVRQLRVALNPYWPAWLRGLKRRATSSVAEKNPASLTNERMFRPVSAAEMAGERKSS